MKRERIYIESEDEKIYRILTSGRPSDEIQAELMKMTPKFEYDEIPEFNPGK